jgi:ATP-dependent DNA helicase RecG
MSERVDQLGDWMDSAEDEHLEFKEAKNRFDFEELVKYCCALANEGGGKIIFGVTDKRPRSVVGSKAFPELQRTKLGLLERLRLRIDVRELAPPEGRVLVFDVPPRPVGVPIQYNGAFWMRGGESLVGMTADQLKRILEEGQPDFSADVCRDATIEDLDEQSVERFKEHWRARTPSVRLDGVDVRQMLQDADLYTPMRGLTYAALILLGRREALMRLLPQSEVIYEYRAREESISFDVRREFREGFLSLREELWALLDQNNGVSTVDLGEEKRSIRSVHATAILEAVVNAICHRDYRLLGSTFVRQSPNRLEITSPGGFLPEVTPENILFCQSPRNRRLAEALTRCGFADRSGQGADRMFVASLQEGKRPPDFQRSTSSSVVVVLHGVVQDPAFITYLERLTKETGHEFHVEDLVVLDAIHGGRPTAPNLRGRVTELLRIGAVERVEAERFVLSQRFYELHGRPGEYTRRRGLDRAMRKELMLQHIRSAGTAGAPLRELAQVLPEASDEELAGLLGDLETEGRVEASSPGALRWVAKPGQDVNPHG